ncbi:MAG: alginate lyase family protein [Acidobacteriota bacterium]
MTAREIAGEVLLLSRRRISRAISRASDSPHTTYVSDANLRRSIEGRSIADVASRIRNSPQPHLTRGLADLSTTVTTVKEFFPEAVEASRLEAEAVLDHRITLFGRAYELGRRIDWHRDPQANLRWPLAHFTRVPLVLGRGADVRVVWELNRLQHLVTLGRAYLLTSDEKYAEEFLLQLASWYEHNPPRFGANWTIAMEAAIRAVNIIAALEMFRGSPHMTDEAIELILKTLIAHGSFIRDNLEFSYRAPSNHYLSDLIGLFVIGMTIPELREARGWVSYSARLLLKEMDRQVLADGADYEGAIGYHRFVLELFALFFSISHASGIEIPGRYWERLEAMFDFVRHYLKPDGTAPIIGDSDDGRLLKFKSRPADDHSYLMSIAAVLIENETFKQSSRIDEEALWWFGLEGREAFESLAISERPAASRAFPEAQIFIQRAATPEGPLYAIIDCGDHGARGHGSHAHSDALSIEVFAFNRTFVRDPGTCVYTASERRRNLFRSTAYHNTVRVDGDEISQTREGELFAFAANVRPLVNSWESTAERDVLDAEHHAYARLAQPVTHRRVVTLDKREGCWFIQDIFTGEGRHRFEFFFNFDAGLEVTLDESNRATARGEKAGLTIVPVSNHTLEAKISSRWVSPAYGIRLNSSAIIYSLAAEVPLEVSFQLLASKSN